MSHFYPYIAILDNQIDFKQAEYSALSLVVNDGVDITRGPAAVLMFCPLISNFLNE